MSAAKDIKKTGAFIVPTGIGASIGGYAGDAGAWARKFAKHANLIVNPNVVNAGGFSAITDNMLYVEGYSLDLFFKGKINLIPSNDNKIGIIYDKEIPQDILNVHINTQNAVRIVYGIDVSEYEITEEAVGVEFFVNENRISTGRVKNIETLGKSCQKLLNRGCNAIAIVCLFEDSDEMNPDYANGTGVDPVGGVEAILSHYISKYYKIPCAHSPAFRTCEIETGLVNPKSASEYITPTYLPCILLGLGQAPLLTEDKTQGININELDFVVMPHDSLGGIPVFESIKRNIPVYAVKENSTVLNVNAQTLGISDRIIEVPTYNECLERILNQKD